ncbi:hypothetical protein FRD01_10165 [Microvenator marinus]|uniref:Uncharacterized protein n=1 Tax=Microvenator marinus TaxID=2600177 RepID=A0A5B8XVV6_9DELT|nr:hypothetical protein [Microvenator marinus]QED27599.1 hypothetical protein FRD01_10165 [Microvenator marinus]
MSTDLPGYCGVVLAGAIQNTMPPAGDPSIYTTHIEFLEQLCANPPSSGNVVQDPPSNLQFLSPPIVIAPLYECAETVGVRGARLNSSVNVFVDGVPVASGVIRDPDSQDFVVPPLQSGQVVWATQTFGGVTSLNSNVVEVRHYLDDYPNGLPAPTIEPQKTHECAYQIAVKHVPGANLMVVTNSGTPRFNGGRSGGYTVALGDGPFSIGDQIEVYQEMCQDESEPSAPIFALAAPSPLRAVAVDPAEVYETQELFQFSSVVEGATVHIDETSVGAIDQIFSWPTHTTHRWDFVTAFGRPFLPGDELAVTQELCVFSPTTQAIVTKSCEELNTLEVATLIAGQDYVIVSNAVPGASIRVYDSNGDEIGDGGESMILLSRQLEEGETITLVQELGVECVSDEGIEYIVNPGSAEPINQ